jgi:thiamine pyrophosphokinase
MPVFIDEVLRAAPNECVYAQSALCENSVCLIKPGYVQGDLDSIKYDTHHYKCSHTESSKPTVAFEFSFVLSSAMS